jgi:hypothetical protein
MKRVPTSPFASVTWLASLASFASFAVVLSTSTTATADDETPPPAISPAPPESALPPDPTPLQPFPPAEPAPSSPVKITPTGYLEMYYAWNFNRPVNGITNYRGFDNRHDTFTLQNAALGTYFESGPVGGKLMLQVGAMGSTYYAAEPNNPGTNAVNASGPDLWKYIQEAYVTYKIAIGRGLELKAGVVASPIGMESFAVHDHWTWSRSNLFFALPYYHTGLRATYEVSERLSAEVAVLNGWNSIVDNNEAKSVESHVTYRVPDKVTAQLLYFGGVERSAGAPVGAYWRHHSHAGGELAPTVWLQLAAQADYGFEPNRFGTARWYAGAIAARAKACRWLYLVARGDRFYEQLATDGEGHASTPLFWNGVEWVSSFTATVDVRPHDNISVRLEFRHDQADGLLYFTGDTLVVNGSATSPYLPNARSQETLLLGATAWF